MPSTITIDLQGVDEVLKKLDPQRYEQVMWTNMDAATMNVQKRFKNAYPPTYQDSPTRPPGYWARQWTPKQRGWFFANLREGNIDMPYRRGQSPGSEKLGSSWTRDIRRAARGLIGTVGTNVSYARLVMKKGMQAAIHVGRWPTIEELTKDMANDIKRIFEQGIRRAVR